MGDELEVTEVSDKIGMAEVLDNLSDDKDDSTSEEKPESAEEIKLSDEDEDTEEEKEESESEESEDEEEVEIKEEDEDELEYQDVPARKAILAKFPDLFKTFPGIERAIFREDQYTKIFPSIQEAKDARQQLEDFSRIQQDIYSGDLSNLLSEVKKSDSKAFDKIANKFLDTINSVDSTAGLKIVNRITKAVLANVATAGKKMKDKGNERGEQYELAAHYMHEALYGDPEITAPDNTDTEDKPDPKAEELKKQQIEFENEKLTSAVQEVSISINNTLESAVKKYIDPKGVMTDYVREKAVKDVLDSLDRDFKSDSRFRQHLDKLWVAARNDRYSSDAKAKIRKAVIAKAQSSLKDHIKFVRSKILKATPNRNAVRREEKPENKKLAPSRNTSQRTDSQKPRRVGGVADVMKFLE